jgi:hypothetical protein
MINGFSSTSRVARVFADTRLVFFLAGRFLVVAFPRVDFRDFEDLDFLRARDFVAMA